MKNLKILFLLIATVINGVVCSSEEISSPEDIIKQMRAESFDALRNLINECDCVSEKEGSSRFKMIMNTYKLVWKHVSENEAKEEWSEFLNKTNEKGDDLLMIALQKASRGRDKESFCLHMAMFLHDGQQKINLDSSQK